MSNRPKPTATKLAEGNRGHRKIEGDDFQPERVKPEMPKGLSPVARREWKYMSRVLFDNGVLTGVDRQCLATYCEAVAKKERANKEMQASGGEVIAVYMTGKDGERLFLRMETNPWWKVWVEACKMEKACLVEFGLTPASRSRLKLPTKPKEDEFDKVMGKRTPRTPVVGFQHSEPEPAPPAMVNRADD